MPEAAIAPPPAPVASPPNPVDPVPVINVVPPAIEPKVPKPGSVMEQMREQLRKKARGNDPAPVTPQAEPPAPEDEPTTPTEVVPAATEPTEVPGEPKPKVNPWKIVDSWKKRAADAEAKLAEAAAAAVNPAEKAKLEQRLAELETRNKELAEEIKFEAYIKSPEYKETYEKPYEQAWNSAMADLGELTVLDGPEERPVTTEDILELVQQKLGPAMETAKEKFGDFAMQAMTHRKAILDLFTAKQKALTDAKTHTEERQKVMQEQQAKQVSEVQASVQQAWNKANDEALNDPKAGKFFKPIEGDDENNKRLERGYQMVDQAWSQNPLDPRLTQQQREQVVKAQAAVRHRAAGFGRVVAENVKLEAQLAEMKQRLEEYEGSTPPAGGSNPPVTPQLSGSVMEQMRAKLRSMAK